MIMAGESKFSKLGTDSFLLANSLLFRMETKKILNTCFIHCKKVHKVPGIPSNPQLLTPSNFTLTWNQVTSKKIQQCRLPSSIRPNNSNTSSHVNTNINVRQSKILPVRITEADLNKLQEWRCKLSRFRKVELSTVIPPLSWGLRWGFILINLPFPLFFDASLAATNFARSFTFSC
ncbi:hypothetical protein O6P43_031461 [Quillaja saponaria]|uniref:Uncharacterized protein n=1 Tax=Quillaja saponaria TaxID=32244 RepID=A0AAD7KVG4_QUISA|nr:hypothetical protein O6P43_031461 [Quillaja saponaria]